MELGADGVLMNTAIAGAQDPVAMAEAMKLAVIAGRLAWLAGRYSPQNVHERQQSSRRDGGTLIRGDNAFGIQGSRFWVRVQFGVRLRLREKTQANTNH